VGRPLFFYAEWPLGYPNPEGERKALALGRAGYEVTYAAGLGLRNPGLRSVRKALRMLAERIGWSAPRSHDRGGAPLRSISPLLLGPRQLPWIRGVNTAWLGRQLEASVPHWPEALAWIRYPTPELVGALARQRPAGVVYECVDAHDHTPGVVGAWTQRLERAERALVSEADLVVVPGEALAERLQALGAEDVRMIPHGVELELFPWHEPRQHSGRSVTAGLVGTLDDRIDVPALRRLAARHPEWRIRLIGPVRDDFPPRSISELDNVSIEPPVEHARLGEVIGGFDLGLMAYRDHPVVRYMCPVKNLEYMAAGKPAVARPNRALRKYEDLLYFAETPEEFCTQAERAVGEDSLELARQRRATAEANTSQMRLRELVAVAREVSPPETSDDSR
jgi:glycosyltransferase involved in cell wall biosynthesis